MKATVWLCLSLVWAGLALSGARQESHQHHLHPHAPRHGFAPELEEIVTPKVKMTGRVWKLAAFKRGMPYVAGTNLYVLSGKVYTSANSPDNQNTNTITANNKGEFEFYAVAGTYVSFVAHKPGTHGLFSEKWYPVITPEVKVKQRTNYEFAIQLPAKWMVYGTGVHHVTRLFTNALIGAVPSMIKFHYTSHGQHPCPWGGSQCCALATVGGYHKDDDGVPVYKTLADEHQGAGLSGTRMRVYNRQSNARVPKHFHKTWCAGARTGRILHGKTDLGNPQTTVGNDGGCVIGEIPADSSIPYELRAQYPPNKEKANERHTFKPVRFRCVDWANEGKDPKFAHIPKEARTNLVNSVPRLGLSVKVKQSTSQLPTAWAD